MEESVYQLKPNIVNRKAIKVLGILTPVFVILTVLIFVCEFIMVSSYKKIDAHIQYLDHEQEVSYVYYEYDNVLYENIKVESYVDDWEYGHKIEGYINPNKPEKFIAFLDMLILPSIMLFPIIIVGIPYLIFKFFNYIGYDMWAKKKNKWQLQDMKISNVRLWRSNFQYDLLIFEAIYEGVKFKSLPMRGDYGALKENILNSNFINSNYYIKVYYNPKNKKQCFFDFETISK